VPVPPDEGWLEPLPPETLPDGGELCTGADGVVVGADGVVAGAGGV
jgi:hypothetical protein